MSARPREDGGVDPAVGRLLEVAQAVPGGPGRYPGGGDDEGDAVTVPPRLLPGRGLRLRLGPRPGRGPGWSPGEAGRHSVLVLLSQDWGGEISFKWLKYSLMLGNYLVLTGKN